MGCQYTCIPKLMRMATGEFVQQTIIPRVAFSYTNYYKCANDDFIRK